MTETSMTIERVLELIEAYGAEPMAWPEEERASAKAFIEAHPDQFEEALTAAHALDQMLLDEHVPEPSSDLTASILGAAPAANPQSRGWFANIKDTLFPQGTRWPAGAALASLMMGLVSGYAYASTGAGYDQADSAYYAAFGFDESSNWLASE